jgi:pyridinium-3,5-biscarboxylic acid mononucleotide sulfurtransferase
VKINKLSNLTNLLKDMQSAVLAFSGGVDSAFLLKVMQLSGMRAIAVTAVSETMPRQEALSAIKMAEEIGIEHRTIRTDELRNENFIGNTPERCFFCKDERFRQISDLASKEGFRFILDGSNSDDLDDYRPGTKAAAKYGVRSPLIEAGHSKKDVRKYAKKLGLAVWNKPSSPCLATRIPYGRRITVEALKRIEKSEEFLASIGFTNVRVRDHYPLARIEVEKKEIDMLLDPERRKRINGKLKSFGYASVSLDLEGYKSGGMNSLLKS